MKQFTNEATQQMLADFDKSPFSDADLAAMDVDARQIIEQNAERGVSLDIENYCTLRLFFDLSTLAGLSRRNLPEAGIRLLFQI